MSNRICILCGKLRLNSKVTPWQSSHRYFSRSKTRNMSLFRPFSVLHNHLGKRGFCSVSQKWDLPIGYDTGIKVYNPIVKDKVPLILKQDKLAQWYACGPTVYDSAHIGHASSYVRHDIIRRILSKVFGIDSTLVMGITDIDDKIIKRASETGQDMFTMSKMYEENFFRDMAKLNISPPDIITRVTDHVPVIIDFIKGIEQRGLAYKTDDGSVYFDVRQYGNYPVLRQNLSDSAEIDENSYKRHHQDFALWKAVKPGEPYWSSPWGNGRPGWHIECSAMASGIFGSNFDLHSGGEDLIFPHHENELAQSCAFHGNSQWVNYWIHTGHLFLTGDEEKMSKSLKNVMSSSELLEDYTANQFRMLCLLSNYRKTIEYSDVRMEKAVSTLKAFNSLIQRCDLYVKGQVNCRDIPESDVYERLHSVRHTIERAFADDFNTPKVLGNLVRLVKDMNQLFIEAPSGKVSQVRSNAPIAAVNIFMNRVLDQLGLDITQKKGGDEADADLKFRKAVDNAVSARSKIRDFAKNKTFLMESAEKVGIEKSKAKTLMKTLYKPLWEASDEIRSDLLKESGVEIKDGADRSSWSIVESSRSQKDKEGKSSSNTDLTSTQSLTS